MTTSWVLFAYYGLFFWGMNFNIYFVAVLVATLVLSGIATGWVKSAFAKYSQVASQARMTGADCAQAILNRYGIGDVVVERSSGFLSDHYAPTEKRLRLSPDVYQGTSLAALGVAAHECGHALQHAEGYVPLYVRSALVPLARFGSAFSYILIIAGVLLQVIGLAYAGVIAFALTTVFALVTLPVEFNASSRALYVLTTEGILRSHEEQEAVRTVLRAAAMTYVAAAITSLLWLLYYAWLVFGRRD